MGFVDLHSHILPDLDDGPEDVATSAQLVLGLESIGFTDFYPTPHQRSGFWTPEAPDREQAASELRALLGELDSAATIHPPAGENMWDELFFTRQDDHSFPTFPGGQSFLVEFQPDGVPPGLKNRLFRFRIAGKLPVLAHVERYPRLTGDLDRLRQLGQTAALLVNLTSLGGADGFWAKRLARGLVQKGLVHAAATDAHGVSDLSYCQAGLKWLESKQGRRGTRQLLMDNPLKIVSGELPDIAE